MRIFSNDKGVAAERAAEQWLIRQGLISVTRNFRCRHGEIDLVMSDNEQLIFVEVRLRSHNDYGGAIESVTRAKQQKILRAAQFFLASEPRWQHMPCRFDVLAAKPREKSAQLEWQWLPAAFTAED